MEELKKQMETLLKEVKEIKENQEEISDRLDRLQQIFDHIEHDDCDCGCEDDEGFEFEIVCPYCENEFVVDLSDDKDHVECPECKNVIECPECKNVIELDWSGELEDGEDDECSGHCHGCCGCGDEDDDM